MAISAAAETAATTHESLALLVTQLGKRGRGLAGGRRSELMAEGVDLEAQIVDLHRHWVRRSLGSRVGANLWGSVGEEDGMNDCGLSHCGI